MCLLRVALRAARSRARRPASRIPGTLPGARARTGDEGGCGHEPRHMPVPNCREAPMSQSTAPTTRALADDTGSAVRPFRIAIPDEALADLRRRIEATVWPERETVPDSSQGVPLATMQELARYWAADH